MGYPSGTGFSGARMPEAVSYARGGRVILLAVDETSTERQLTDALTELRRRQQVCDVPKIRDDLVDAIDRVLDYLWAVRSR